MSADPKNLLQEPPRSPRTRIAGFAILARAIDKCRAVLAGTKGEYKFNCELDKMLFEFKGISGEDFKKFVAEGHTDEEIAAWVKKSGTPKTDAEVTAWSDAREHFSYHTDPDPENREWFDGECIRLHLNPETTALFDYLEADDKTSFKR